MTRSSSRPLALAGTGSLSLHAIVMLGVVWVAPSPLAHRRAEPFATKGDTWEVDTVRPLAAPLADLGAANRAPAPEAVALPEPDPPHTAPEIDPVERRGADPVESAPAAPSVETTRNAAPEDSPAAHGGAAETTANPDAGATDSGGGTGTTLGGGSEFSEVQRAELLKEFTRYLPRAGRSDPFWSSRAVGFAESARVELVLDDGGRLARVTGETGALAPHWQRLMERTRLYLKMGRFSVGTSDATLGTTVLVLSANGTEGPMLREETYDPRDSVGLGFEPPARGRPGRATFGFPSGRQVEIRVELAP
jgi:hypothetical protein